MAKTGRPHVLDEKKKARILSLLTLGCSRTIAATAVRCHPHTILNTANRDPDFAEKLALADNASELIHIENINRAGREVKYWRASAWMLERLNPERFARANPDAITPSQITSIILQIAEIIIQEIPAAQHRAHLLERFDQVLIAAGLVRHSVPQPSAETALLELEPLTPARDDNESD
jgi:hypothetical protein